MGPIENTLTHGLSRLGTRSRFICNAMLHHPALGNGGQEAAANWLTEYLGMDTTGEHFGGMEGPEENARALHARRIFLEAAIHLAHKLGA